MGRAQQEGPPRPAPRTRERLGAVLRTVPHIPRVGRSVLVTAWATGKPQSAQEIARQKAAFREAAAQSLLEREPELAPLLEATTSLTLTETNFFTGKDEEFHDTSSKGQFHIRGTVDGHQIAITWGLKERDHFWSLPYHKDPLTHRFIRRDRAVIATFDGRTLSQEDATKIRDTYYPVLKKRNAAEYAIRMEQEGASREADEAAKQAEREKTYSPVKQSVEEVLRSNAP